MRNVLIVDDDAVLRRAMGRLLRDWPIVLCDGGTSAVAILRQGEEFEAILCDLHMPDMTGAQVYAHIVAHHPELVDRFIVLTGGATSTEDENFMTQTGCPTVAKPFTKSDLAAAIALLDRETRARLG